MPRIEHNEEFTDEETTGVTDTEESESDNEEGTQEASPASKNDPDEEESKDSETVDDSETEGGTSEIETKEEPSEKKSQKTQEDIDAITNEYHRLLGEVTNLRSERRDLRGGPFHKEKKDEIFTKKEDDPLAEIAKEDVAVIEKVLQAKGYVRKDDVEYSSIQKEVDSASLAWVEENKEFSPDNDPNDEKWNRLVSYVKENFAVPRSGKKAQEYLDIARERLFGKKQALLPQKSPNSIAAKKEKIAVSSAKSSGGGTSADTSKTSKNAPIDKGLAVHLQGFSDEEIKEIMG
ncbi:MAG: hypothetical protein WC346_17060 [Methanogenium sp.]|jgi:hypothetical protein